MIWLVVTILLLMYNHLHALVKLEATRKSSVKPHAFLITENNENQFKMKSDLSKIILTTGKRNKQY